MLGFKIISKRKLNALDIENKILQAQKESNEERIQILERSERSLLEMMSMNKERIKNLKHENMILSHKLK
jgi:hypothetical protein